MSHGLTVGWTAALCVILGSHVAAGQHWARFRGPNGCGESEATTVPVQWTPRDYRWKVELPGPGHSSPVVWDDRVVITSAREDGENLSVLCLATADGTTIWSRTMATGRSAKSPLNSFASSTPALDAKHVYATWTTPAHYVIAALSLHSGDEVWRREFEPFHSEHGLGASPVVWEDMVIVPNDQDGPSSVLALEGVNGKTRWQTNRRRDRKSVV